MSIDPLVLDETLRSEKRSVNAGSAGEKQDGSRRISWLFLIHPLYAICDIQDNVRSLGMLIEEASERAEKPWYQRLPED